MPPSTRSAGIVSSGVGLRRLHEVGAPVRDAFEHGPHDLGPPGTAGQAEERAARAVVPGRRSESEQCRHVDDSTGVVAAGRDLVGLVRALDETEVVAQPLHVGTRREHHGFDPPRHPGSVTPRHDGKRSRGSTLVERGSGLAENDVEHGAGPEGDLGVAGPYAALPDQRSLLVAEQRRDRRCSRQRLRGADDAGGIDDRGQHLGRHAEHDSTCASHVEGCASPACR